MNSSNKTGIVLINTGTPDAPTPKALRRYLREFLADPRVIQLPRWLWLPILYGIVLPLRSKRSARLYQRIWQPNGAPMRIAMQALADKLSVELSCSVVVGMNYGQPAIDAALAKLEKQGVKSAIILPLFPQYSHTSTSASLDRVKRAIRTHSTNLSLTTIKQYAEHPAYIEALAKTIEAFWSSHGKSQQLLISFHGIPKRYVSAGDPYADQCSATAHALAKALNLTPHEWTLCFQSKFGYDKWLEPSLQTLFSTLPQQNIHSIDVVCPGFAVDCLETLEEIAITGKKLFTAAGGKTLHYIPALNATSTHLTALKRILLPHLLEESSTT